MELTLREALEGWGTEDRANLWALLIGESTRHSASLTEIEGKFKWLYHSRVRAGSVTLMARLYAWVRSRLDGTSRKVRSMEERRDTPSFSLLLEEASKARGVFEKDASSDELAVFLSHDVVIHALENMRPRERIRFFEQTFSIDEVAAAARIDSGRLRGPMTALAALGAAQASGFGVYLAATTALGFATHAVGVTLPFAVYTGMTSTIAFLIGPAGFLAAGLWGTWKLTGPNWKRLIPAILYVAATNARRRLEAEPERKGDL